MKKILTVTAVAAIILITGLLFLRSRPPRAKVATALPPRAAPSPGPAVSVPPIESEHPTSQTSATQEQKNLTLQKQIDEGVKLLRQVAFARAYARLEPILRQSGLSDFDIDRSVSLYMELSTATTQADRQAMIEKMKAQVGEEVYEGIEKAEEAYRDSVRDNGLLTALKDNLPTVQEADIAAAKAGFALLPNYNTLFMQEVKFQPATVDVGANLQAAAEAAFDKAFANSPISASVREQLRKTYLATATHGIPTRKK